MHVYRAIIIPTLLAIVTASCSDNTIAPGRIEAGYTFRQTDLGFQNGAADFPADQEASVNYLAELRALPAPLDGTQMALYHSGVNVSGELFMYFTGALPGLAPFTSYRAEFEVEFATNVGSECTTGLGASAFIKAGASSTMPLRFLENDGSFRMNIDNGAPGSDGLDAIVLGNMRNTLAGCPTTDAPYGINTVTSTGSPITVMAGGDGNLWLFMATASTFDGAHDAYFLRLFVTLDPI